MALRHCLLGDRVFLLLIPIIFQSEVCPHCGYKGYKAVFAHLLRTPTKHSFLAHHSLCLALCMHVTEVLKATYVHTHTLQHHCTVVQCERLKPLRKAKCLNLHSSLQYGVELTTNLIHVEDLGVDTVLNLRRSSPYLPTCMLCIIKELLHYVGLGCQ